MPVARDDDFEPKLGKIRSRGSKRGRKYLHRVLQAMALAGGRAQSASSSRKAKFHGSQIGRGASIARMLGSRDRYAAFRSRRVVVKFRIAKLAGNGIKGAGAHIRYIQRDGVTRDGHPGQLYSAEQDRVDGKAFIERADGDRHQFRFILAPEDGAEYDDLKPFVRRLMTQMEEDLAQSSSGSRSITTTLATRTATSSSAARMTVAATWSSRANTSPRDCANAPPNS